MKFMKSNDCYSHENISLSLDSYDDIFSDFDPRPYSDRSLSVDFIDEARRASIDKPSGGVELRLLVPKSLRDEEEEKVIKKRLKSHFEKHAKILDSQRRKIFRNGITFTVTGVTIMILAAFFLFDLSGTNYFMHFLLVLFEPAGWFFFWEGLDMVFFDSKKEKPGLEFYRKMTKSDIVFLSC